MKNIIVVMLLLSLTGSICWAAPSPFSAPADDKIRAAEGKQPAPPRSAGLVDSRVLKKINALPPAPTTKFDYHPDPKLWPPATRMAAVAPPARQPVKQPTGQPTQPAVGQPGRQSDQGDVSPSDKPKITPVPAKDITTPIVTTTAGDSADGSVTLKRIKGFSDFTGRGEKLRHDGSPDAHLNLIAVAPNKTLTGLALRTAGDGKAQWDTTPGNKVWLLAVTKDGNVINRRDGSIRLALGSGEQNLSLWVQDNHTLARGKKRLELVMTFAEGDEIILRVDDTLKR